jgi:hypothetical protein
MGCATPDQDSSRSPKGGLWVRNIHDGSLWDVEEILPNGIVKVRRPRAEIEQFAEATPGDRWGYLTPLGLAYNFGITPKELIEALM